MKTLLFLLVTLGTLVLFNPSQDRFAAFVEERTLDVVSENARVGAGPLFGDLTGTFAGEVAGALAAGGVARENYGVFSVYTLDLNGRHNEGGAWRFLGVGGQFFELEHPAVLEG